MKTKTSAYCGDGSTKEWRSNQGEVVNDNVEEELVCRVRTSEERGGGDAGGVPFDRGWAWVICWSCFMVYYVYVGYDQMMSVLLVDIMRDLDTSISVLSVMFSVTSLFYCVITQVTANFLLDRVTNRSLETAAAVTNVLSTLVFVTRPGLTSLFIASCVKSAAKGATFIPTLTLVGQYFQRRRALAISLAMVGGSLSSVTVPPLMRYLIEEYGLRGCFLLFSAVEMHAIIATMLLRPTQSYKIKQTQLAAHREDCLTEKYQLLAPANEETDNPASSAVGISAEAANSPSYGVRLSAEAGIESIHVTFANTEESFESNRISNVTIPKDADGQTETKTESHNSVSDPLLVEPNNMRRIRLPESAIADRVQEVNYFERVESLNRLERGSRQDQPMVDKNTKKGDKDENNVIGNHGNLLGRKTVKINTASRLCTKVYSWIRIVIDFNLLKNSLCIMAICIYCLCCGGLLNLMYLPSYAISVGVPPQDAAILLTITGVCDVVGKIVAGFAADSKVLKVNVIMAITTLSMGVVSQFVWCFTSFGLLVTYAAVQGLMGSVGANLMVVLIVELMGLKNLGKTMAMCSLFLSVSLAAQHPIIGALIDYTGDYVVSYHYVGTMYLLVTGVLLFVPLVKRFHLFRD